MDLLGMAKVFMVRHRRVALLAGVLVAGLSGCGGATRHASGGRSQSSARPLSPGVVAQAGGNSITKSQLAHWTRVQAVLAYEYKPNSTLPKGFVPDPPGYTACIGYLAGKADRQSSRPSRKQLKQECIQRQQGLQQAALGVLIVNDWMLKEASRRGMTVSAAEAESAAEQYYSGAPGYRRFVTSAGVSLSDQRLVAESHLVLDRIQLKGMSPALLARIQPGGPGETARNAEEVDAHDQAVSTAISNRWTPTTHCRAGYVVSDCSEYAPPREGS